MTEMTCGEIEAKLSRLLDGELEPRERVRVEAHLGRCARCREAFAALRALDERARAAVRTLHARPRFASRVVASIERQQYERRRRARVRLVRLSLAGALAAAAAAVLLLALPSGPTTLKAKPALIAGEKVEGLDAEGAWRTRESGRATILLGSGRGLAYLGPATEARFTASGAELAGTSAKAYFDIEPGRGGYRVTAGDVRVDVLGTRFAVERRNGRPWVAVLEGKVTVALHWNEKPVGETPIIAGEAFSFDGPTTLSEPIVRDRSFDARAYAPDGVPQKSLASPWPEPAGSAAGAYSTVLAGPAGPEVTAVHLEAATRSAERVGGLILQADGTVLRLEGAPVTSRFGGYQWVFGKDGTLLGTTPYCAAEEPTSFAFQTPTNLTGLMRPAIGPAGHVFGASRDGYLLAFSPEGRDLRRDKLGGAIPFPPSAAPDASVWCVTESGAVWRAPEAGGRPARVARLRATPSAPLVTDGKGRAYIALADGRLLALDASGKTLWIWRSPAGAVAALAIGRNGRLVAAASSGALWAITDR